MGTPDPARVVVGGELLDGVLGIINVSDHDLELRPVSGIDPTLALMTLTADRVPVEQLVVGARGAAAWQDALVWGRIALAAELVGTGRAALSLATEHAANRVQFGQPIGSFQAVKHRLANALIEIEAAASAVAAAAVRPTRLSAMVAKSAAGRAARIGCAQALQVLGAVGFTLEHPFHRFQCRAIALDHLLGSSDDLPREIGALLRTVDSVPAIVDLEDDQ
jgi:alkylation response protein AidB-like acyl-CoA dehydrogenase